MIIYKGKYTIDTLDIKPISIAYTIQKEELDECKDLITETLINILEPSRKDRKN